MRFRPQSLDKVQDAVAAHAAIVAGEAIGELTPSEAGDLARLDDNYTRATSEATDIQTRLARLEAAGQR